MAARTVNNIMDAFTVMTGTTIGAQEMIAPGTFAYYKDPANAAALIANANAKLAEEYEAQQAVDPVVQDPVDPVVQDPVDPVVQDPVDPVVQDPVDPVVQDPVVQDPVDPVVQTPKENTFNLERARSVYGGYVVGDNTPGNTRYYYPENLIPNVEKSGIGEFDLINIPEELRNRYEWDADNNIIDTTHGGKTTFTDFAVYGNQEIPAPEEPETTAETTETGDSGMSMFEGNASKIDGGYTYLRDGKTYYVPDNAVLSKSNRGSRHMISVPNDLHTRYEYSDGNITDTTNGRSSNLYTFIGNDYVVPGGTKDPGQDGSGDGDTSIIGSGDGSDADDESDDSSIIGDGSGDGDKSNISADGSGDGEDGSAVVAPPATLPEGFTEEEYTEFTDEFVPLFRSRFNREPNANDINYHLKYFYGDKTFDDNEKAELGRAADVERTRNLSFSREVTDFFLRTLGRPPSSQELDAYTATYYRPEQNDFSLSQRDIEQELSPQGTLFEERKKKYGLDDYTQGDYTSPGQITRLLTATTGKSPTADERSEAYKFFEDIGQYGTNPRQITARDAQAYKEQVVTPRQLAQIPINVTKPPATSTNLSPNLPTLPSTPAPGTTATILDDAVTGGIATLPTGSATTPPTPVSITPDTDVYSEQYFKDKFLPKEETVIDKPVGLARGGNPLVEGIRSRNMQRMTRARDDLKRIMAQGS